MDWNSRLIAPKEKQPPKVNTLYPCPGLCRLACTISFLVVGLGGYYLGIYVFGLESLNWAAPVWTAKHVGLVAVCFIFGAIAGLSGFAYAMKIEVQSERLSNFIIVLWQFLANGSLYWLFMIGIAMSVSMGKDEAKIAVLNFGAELATLHVVATGSVVSLLMGVAFFLAEVIRLPFIVYIVFSATVSLFAARWHFLVYGIQGQSWIAVGMVVPIFLTIFAPSMIERDRRQRRLAMEQSSK